MPDQRFIWIRLDAMAEVGDFDSTEASSNSTGHGRASPVSLTECADTFTSYKIDDETLYSRFQRP